jgi:hypothetical protein
MALFDTNSGLGGLLGDLSDYGFGVPKNTGLIADPEREAINKRALMSGGISALLTYLATPKNLNAGSALPYLGRAGLAGFGASQDVVDRALNTAYRNKMLAGKDDNIRTYEKDRQKITEQFNPITKTWETLGTSALDAPKDTKSRQYTGNFENVAINMFPGVDPEDLNEVQRKQVFNAVERLTAAGTLARLPLQEQEAAYNIGRPQQSVSVTAGGKTYYFKDQNSANLFRQKAGIK